MCFMYTYHYGTLNTFSVLWGDLIRLIISPVHKGHSWASLVAQIIKNPPVTHAGDLGLIPGWGRSSGEGNGCPLQYSGLENSMDRGVWWTTVHGFAEFDTTKQLTH